MPNISSMLCAAHDINREIDKLLDPIQIDKTQPEKLIPTMLWMATHEQFKATLCLIENRFSLDAPIVMRSMLEGLVKLLNIARDPSFIDQIKFNDANKSWKLMKELRKHPDWESDPRVPETMRRLEEATLTELRQIINHPISTNKTKLLNLDEKQKLNKKLAEIPIASYDRKLKIYDEIYKKLNKALPLGNTTKDSVEKAGMNDFKKAGISELYTTYCLYCSPTHHQLTILKTKLDEPSQESIAALLTSAAGILAQALATTRHYINLDNSQLEQTIEIINKLWEQAMAAK